jgi:hypothetical protein
VKRTAVAVLLAACGSSSGAPPHDAGKRAPTPARALDAGVAPPPEYKKALKHGWDLAHAGDHAGAVAAFEGALWARPDDPRALTELSWEALQNGDLTVARRAADRAITVAKDPRLQAQAYYNRGRCAEASGDTAAAKADYQHSLALRANRTVTNRLEALGDASLTLETTSPLAGPFDDAAGFCAELGLPASDVGDPTLEDDVWCSVTPLEVPEVKTLPTGVDRIAVFRHAETTNGVSLDLALHTARGWWVLTDFGVEDAWPSTGITIVEATGAGVDLLSSTGGDNYRTYCTTAGKAPTCSGPWELPK